MKKYIIGFILGALIFCTIGVYAAIELRADQIGYGTGTVKEAIDDLYAKKSQGVQVATLTTQGATYTMQNDGYIIGTARPTYNIASGQIFFDGEVVFFAVYDEDWNHKVSIYAPKGSVVTTRSNGGVYNLTVYEWK